MTCCTSLTGVLRAICNKLTPDRVLSLMLQAEGNRCEELSTVRFVLPRAVKADPTPLALTASRAKHVMRVCVYLFVSRVVGLRIVYSREFGRLFLHYPAAEANIISDRIGNLSLDSLGNSAFR